jgi:hypothetical protein
MEAETHSQTLKRVGVVLVVIGSIDVGVMIYCIVNRIAYSSSFNIFAIAAGILLLRGSLRTAAYARWFCVFMLAASVAALGAMPFIQPLDLSLTEVRLHTGRFAIGAVFYVLAVGLLFWLQKQLGAQSLTSAIAKAGLKRRDMRYPAILGVGLAVILGVAVPMISNGEAAGRAKTLVQQQVGPGYKLYVTSMRIVTSGGRSTASGVVTAWNDWEIRSIPFSWAD